MNRIKDLRQEQGLLQRDIESALNIGRSTLSNYENEKRTLSPALINQLCDIFHVSADYLLCRSDVPDPYLSGEDAALIRAYHAAPENVRSAIDSLLQPGSGKEKPAGSEARVAG